MDIVFPFIGLSIGVLIANHFLASKYIRTSKSNHFNGKTFFNIHTEGYEGAVTHLEKQSFFSLIKQRINSDWVRSTKLSHHTIPKERVYGSELVVTYVNHSTVLIQTEGLNILTDPIWSNRASPFTHFGPRRFAPPGVDFSALPPIDIVIVSHNHYDHMDIATLRKIYSLWNPKIFVPLGNKQYLAEREIFGVHEMDWWDKEECSNDLRIVAVPAQHFSSRAFSDRNRTLWSGFVIETSGAPIYFAGDTGYGSFLESIKERYQYFRLALLPVGAYKPEWFMHDVHISPDEAYLIHRKLSVQTSIGIHFGTFHLAGDRQGDPPERISEMRTDSPLYGSKFLTLQNGEFVSVSE